MTRSGERYFCKNSLRFLRVIKEVEMVGVPNKPSQISTNFRFIAAPVSAGKGLLYENGVKFPPNFDFKILTNPKSLEISVL